jgi:hypothetical protein
MVPVERAPASVKPVSGLDAVVTVLRGEDREICRVRLLEDGSASLQRFVNGAFIDARIFHGDAQADGFDARAPNDPAKLDRAIRYIARYLDGTANIGERDLLSPTSAVARNLRWLPGDIQMIRTAAWHLGELFPAAQFHVGQLFRRLFGDASFLALIGLTSALLLWATAPPAYARLALVLQIGTIGAIVGFDRYWEPIRCRWQASFHNGLTPRPWKAVVLAPAIVASQLVVGTLSLLFSTIVGLANLGIQPSRVVQALRRLDNARALDWMASSVSAGQDMRGWPLREFASVFAPATRLGVVMLVGAAWLAALGAPVSLLGLNGVGWLAASFSTAFFYAWYCALPHAAQGGAPLYRLRPDELRALTLGGAAALGVGALLWTRGLFPLPSLEGSPGFVAFFLCCTALFALLYTSYCAARQAAVAWPTATRRLARVLAYASGAAASALTAWALFTAPRAGIARVAGFFHRDAAMWRIPEAERRVFTDVEAAMLHDGFADPEPPLKDTGAQPALQASPLPATPDLQDLHGLPNPRLPSIVPLHEPPLVTLYPLPPALRLAGARPKREFLLPPAASDPRPPGARWATGRAFVEAQRRGVAGAPRLLSEQELSLQRAFIDHADYPWITRDELAALAEPNEKGERVDLMEVARVHRWDVIRASWDSVEAARRGGAPDRARLARLSEAVDALGELGRDTTPEALQQYLDTELSLAGDWSRRYPRIPWGSTRGFGPSAGRFSQIARLISSESTARADLARGWRLDYVDAYWDSPPVGPSLARVFHDRPRQTPAERLELDWEDNDALRSRWDELQTEQSVASRVWRAAAQPCEPTVEELRETAVFLDNVLSNFLRGSSDGPYALLGRLFQLEGVAPNRVDSGDAVAALLASRLWTQTVGGRVARMVAYGVSGQELPGTPEERALLRQVARTRYPDDGGDPKLRAMLDWLPVVDATETYREMSTGYDAFVREAKDRGLPVLGLAEAPRIADAEIVHDLIGLWRGLPRLYPNIPIVDDGVGEFILGAAYFSSADGAHRRTVPEFVADFADLLRAVDGLVGESPPAAIEDLANRQIEATQGRSSRSAAGRRFFGWWACALQARIASYNFVRRGTAQKVDAGEVAALWAQIESSAADRWPHLPWTAPGFADFFLQQAIAHRWNADALWARFGEQLGAADRLAARHVVPFLAFETVVDRRVQARWGWPTLDPAVRKANALVGLAELLRVVQNQGIHSYDGNPAKLSEDFALLRERLGREFPALPWDDEGMLEYYLLVQVTTGWTLEALVDRFRPEWSTASALVSAGWLGRLQGIASREPSDLSPEERDFRLLIDTQGLRVEESTGARPSSDRGLSMSALGAWSALIVAALDEGQGPELGAGSSPPPGKPARSAGLQALEMGPATLRWAESLVHDWGGLLRAMRESAPLVPWHQGGVVETNLLAMRNAGATPEQMRAGLAPTWSAANDLFARDTRVPPAFARWVMEQSAADLRRRIANARGVAPSQVPDAEAQAVEPSLVTLEARLALADVVAQIRAKYGEDPDPVWVADRIVEVQRSGPMEYPALPWDARGFVPSLVVGSYQRELRDDFKRYAEFAGLPEADRLLGLLGTLSTLSMGALPAVIDDERTLMRERTGRTPASDPVVVFQALHDGAVLLHQFVPEVAVNAESALTMARLRARVRALSSDYRELHIVTTDDHGVRIGFAERLAALAMREALRTGLGLDDPAFVPKAVDLVKDRFLGEMNKVYELVRASFLPEELAFAKQAVAHDALDDNRRRARGAGLDPRSLSVPDVVDDDIVSDVALYEILYAREIGRGPAYVEDLFRVYDRIRQRPRLEGALREDLAQIDGAFAASKGGAFDPKSAAWRLDPRYGRWLEQRGERIRRWRGRLVALSRTFALVEERAFAAGADPEARAAFRRFGSFEAYVDAFFDDFERIDRLPGLAPALRDLEDDDATLADGVRFAFAVFDLHVVHRIFPDPEERQHALEGISGGLPALTGGYRSILGFVPRLESGVPLYDARKSWIRSQIEPGPGVLVWQRLDLLQRSLQSWKDKYLLEQAYRVLFHRDLDEDDPSPAREATGWLGRWTPRWARPTRGEEVRAFLERRLPDFLERATGSRDVRAWIDWLCANGEVDLDGTPTGNNAFRAALDRYEARLAVYRKEVEEGTAAGRTVRAQEQRVRDLERQRGLLTFEVERLKEMAAVAGDSARDARRDYVDALRLAGYVALALLSGWAVARRIPGRLLALRRAGVVAAIGLPLLAGVGAPVLVACYAPRVPPFGGAVWRALHLVEDDGAGARIRGAAAQLAKSRVWTALFDVTRSPRESESVR